MPNWNDYKEPNIGLLFYKHIYQESSILAKLKSEGTELSINIPTSDKTSPFDSFYKEIYNRTFNSTEQIENTAATQRFDLFTTYPGLLSGSGYQHDTKAKGDFKIGFFFDHSTGQPILPGSSVKGVLHSLFEMDNKMVNDTSNTGEQSVAAIQFICESLIKKSAPPEKEAWGKIKEGITEKSLKTLADAIFGTQEKEGTDIFYDAVIHIAKSESKDKKFLAPDYITPHENPLKNPIPLLFLKVLPNVAFQFCFRLKDNGDWTAQRKELFFKEILLTIGIGAKTNVGYGQFSETPIKTIVAEPFIDNAYQESTKKYKSFQKNQPIETKSKMDIRLEQMASKETPKLPKIDDSNFIDLANVKLGDIVEATVLSYKPGNNLVQLHIKGSENMNIQGMQIQEKQVKVKIKTAEGSHQKGNFRITKVEVIK